MMLAASTAEFGRLPGETYMAEGFELVRTIRQHLRRGAALLDEGKHDEALAEVEAALTLDAHSLPAQALRDRIHTAQKIGRAPAPVSTGTAQAAGSFVPHGVNAASWRGFEQRITERRFRALLETVNTSIVAGDAAAARAALDEARELRPDAPELASFEARVSAVPIGQPADEQRSTPRIWMRAMGAAALLLVGVSLLLGLESMHPSQPLAPAAAASVPSVPAAPTAEPTPDSSRAPTVDSGFVLEDDNSVPAVVLPPEPLLRPRATTGTRPSPPPPSPTIGAGPIASLRETVNHDPSVRETAAARETPAPVVRTLERRPVAEDAAVRPAGEVPDDYVASRRGPTISEPARSVASRPPDAVPARPTAAAPASTASNASAVVVAPMEQSRVEEVLRRYARAYGELDASAARAVWPTVNEKALARAFQNLASQNVSFDDCDIDIRGTVANASCRGQASYVGKVGRREPRTESGLWRFELRRDGEAWKIENAEMRRQSAAEYRDQ